MSSITPSSRFCCLFKISVLMETQTVKESLERIIGRPDTIRSVYADQSINGFVIETETDDAWKKLFDRRKSMRIGDASGVLVFPQNILGPVELVHDKELLWLVDPQISGRSPKISLYENVRVFPMVQRNAPWSRTMIIAENLDDARAFTEKITTALFDSFMLNFGSTEPPPSSSTPDKSKKQAWVILNLTLPDGKYSTEIGCGNIFAQDVQAVVLPVDEHLRFLDRYIEHNIYELTGWAYKDIREEYLFKHSNVKPGDIIFLQTAGSLFIPNVILAVNVMGPVDGEYLSGMYSKCLMRVSELKVATVAILPFTNADVSVSANAAACAYLNAMTSLEIRPKLVRFVHFNPVVKRFAEVFADFFGSHPLGAGIPIQMKAEYSDEGKLDTATGTSKPKPAKEPDTGSHLLDPFETVIVKQPPAPKSRQSGQRGRVEKARSKKETKDQLEKEAVARAMEFVQFLHEEFPSEEVCGICGMALTDQSMEENAMIDETDICPRCYRQYHPQCLDSNEVGGCIYCFTEMTEKDGITIGEQLPGGEMTVRIVNDSNMSVPGYSQTGHIEITYSVPSDVTESNYPKPSTFCFGIHKVAYLPNTDEGKRVAAMLRVAFQRRLTFCVKKSLALTGSYDLSWSFIPHKTKLTGGRAEWGYPDDTYLTRIKILLNNLRIDTPVEIPKL